MPVSSSHLRADVEDHAAGVGGPGNLGVEFDGVTVVIFAFDEGLFGLLAPGDIDDGDGDADDLIDLVPCGLVGDEEGALLIVSGGRREGRSQGRRLVCRRARGGGRVRTREIDRGAHRRSID